MTALDWIATDESLPPDGLLIWWEHGGRCVTGYRFGNLWVIPWRRGIGPFYCKRPGRWARA